MPTPHLQPLQPTQASSPRSIAVIQGSFLSGVRCQRVDPDALQLQKRERIAPAVTGRRVGRRSIRHVSRQSAVEIARMHRAIVQAGVTFDTCRQRVVVVGRFYIQIVSLTGAGQPAAHLTGDAVAPDDQVAQRGQGSPSG